jgi:DNA-directed RNA polymerase subunit H (RpoH/RPB5)
LLQAKKYQIRMLHDRGYAIPDEELALYYPVNAQGAREERLDYRPVLDYYLTGLYGSAAQLLASVHQRLHNLYQPTDNSREPVYVYYVYHGRPGKVGSEPLEKAVGDIAAQHHRKVILVLQAEKGPQAKNTLDALKHVHLQEFQVKELLYNPLDVAIVPPHRLCTTEERRNILEDIHAHAVMLPTMLVDDRIAKYFDWPAGQIVRVEQSNLFQPTALADKTLAFRTVVAQNT